MLWPCRCYATRIFLASRMQNRYELLPRDDKVRTKGTLPRSTYPIVLSVQRSSPNACPKIPRNDANSAKLKKAARQAMHLLTSSDTSIKTKPPIDRGEMSRAKNLCRRRLRKWKTTRELEASSSTSTTPSLEFEMLSTAATTLEEELLAATTTKW